MEQYISKSALVTEIEKLVDKGKYHDDYDYAFRDGNNAALYALKEKINTLEVKEVGVDLGDPQGDKSAKYIIDTKTLEVKEINLDFEQELYKAFGQIKDFTLGIAIAKRFYDMGRKHNEPVSEDLEEAAKHYLYSNILYDDVYVGEPTDKDCIEMFKAGAEWQKEQDYFKIIYPRIITEGTIEQYAHQVAYDMSNDWAIDNPTWNDVQNACKLGAKWQKQHLWKPADGDDLPEIDREVIVLIKYNTQRNIHDEEYPTYRVGFGHRPNPNGWDGKNIDTNEVTHYTPELYDKGGWNAPNIVYWLDYDINELLCR